MQHWVQVRIVLEETYAALADAAGNGRSTPPAAETGVYMGCINYEYTEVLERSGAKARFAMVLMRHCCDDASTTQHCAQPTLVLTSNNMPCGFSHTCCLCRDPYAPQQKDFACC